MMFLHASLVDEPQRAMPMYERIVESYPSSEWADDALLRVTLYAAQRRDTIKARRSLMTFRDQFSKSELLAVAADAVRMSVGLPAAGERPAVAEKTAAKTAEPAVKPSTKFVIQVGSFSTRVLAAKATASYTAKRMLARVSEKKVSTSKTVYVIHVGEYATEAEASKDLGAVGAICKCKPIVVKL
ncbi:MAG: SPOR domain-containing protein [Candidatus Kapabacteria bacterium]|nr:SPOR domain-containing protein [Candidatus Kapabacteria bacterium]